MKSGTAIFATVGIQLVIDIFMWYFATSGPYAYQAYWAILLAVNLMLVAVVMLIILRYYIRSGEIHG